MSHDRKAHHENRQFHVAVDAARHQLEMLVSDAKTQRDGHEHRITRLEVTAITLILAELHRLHLALQAQRRTITDLSKRQPGAHRSPPAGRTSLRPTAQARHTKRGPQMTHRTETNPPTRIERATADTVASIRHNARHFYDEYNVATQHHTTPNEFLRILALYLHDKTLAEWCRDLGIPDATNPADKPSHGGEA
jgi:hypothetical protein